MKLLNDWPKKLLALFIAFVIWFYVFQTGKTKRIYAVNVEIKNEPAHLIAKETFRKAVQVEIEGEKTLFTNFNPQSIQCILDLSNAKKGKGEYLVRLNRTYIATGLSVKILNPLVKIHFEEIVSKPVRVIARTEGTVPYGYVVRDINIAPEEIEIKGPSSIINKINKVYTQVIDIRGKTSTFDVDVKIDKIHEQVKIKKQKSVKVSVMINAEMQGRVLKNIPVKVLGLPKNLKIINGELKLKEIELKGPVAMLQKLDPSDISAFILITNKQTGRDIETKIHITPIRGLAIVNYKPRIIKIRLAEK